MMARNIGIVHPAPGPLPSGGHVYNASLLEYAQRCGWPLRSVSWPARTLPQENWDLLIWDSLLLDRIERLASERVGVLLHYLPAMDPTLEQSGRPVLHAVEERAVATADFVIVTGNRLAEVVKLRWPGKPVFVCEPGVGAAFFRTRKSHVAGASIRLLTVANLLPAKGHEPLLEILWRLRHLPWHWHVVGHEGDPGTAARLRLRAAQTGLSERVSLHGALPQHEVAAWMASSDLLVQPSSFEAYGMAVAEAAAVGLPVLSFRVGAAEQLIRHGVTGLLAAVGYWDGFGRHLETLLTDAALRSALGRNLRAVPVRGWDRTLADFRAACEAMLSAY